MEGILALSLAGLGYAISNMKKRSESKTESKTEGFVTADPYPIDANAEIMMNSRDSLKEGIPARDHFREQYKPVVSRDPSQSPYYSSLAGVEFGASEFTHNNMTPFFRGSVKQSLDENANKSVLDNYTGVGYLHQTKKEQRPLFSNMRKNMGNVNGLESHTQDFHDRIASVKPKLRNNELPFEQVRVGPGLDDGYTALPSGGFNQEKARDAALPPTVDELRVASNPKVSYEGRMIDGKAIVTNRGITGVVKHYRPDRFAINEGGKYNGGARADYSKPTVRSDVEVSLKHENREDTTVDYYGNAAPAEMKETYHKGIYRDPHTQQLADFGVRNAYAGDRWVASDKDVGDYGRSGITILPNERSFTGQRTHVSNVTTAVKAMIAPIQDIFRTTRKENFIGNLRGAGNARGPDGSYIRNEDVARVTVREELDSVDYNRNMRPAEAGGSYVIDPVNHVARETGRETLDAVDTTRNFKHAESGASYVNNGDQAKATGRETLDDVDTQLNVVPSHGPKGYVYDPSQIARITTREQTTDNEYIGAPGQARDGAYLNEKYLDIKTHRQSTSVNYTGNAKNDTEKPMSYDSMYNAVLNESKEKVARGRYPTPVGASQFNNEVNVETKKIESDYMNSRDTIPDKVYNEIPGDVQIGIMTVRPKPNIDIAYDRNNPEILAALRSNPYNKSIADSI